MAGQKIVSWFFLLGTLAALSACAADSTATPLAPAPAAEPAPQRLTATQISEQCWMKNEANKGDIDQRMKIVNKCIDDRMKAAGAPAPKT